MHMYSACLRSCSSFSNNFHSDVKVNFDKYCSACTGQRQGHQAKMCANIDTVELDEYKSFEVLKAVKLLSGDK